MEVSLPPGSQELICDRCGYPRRGLSARSNCPECGESPPKLLDASFATAGTVEELRWLRTLAVGIWLLIIASIGALQVTLIMPIGELSIGAINYPGPKLFASALVQRTIGGQPGDAGVHGTLCVMLSAMAVFLLTEPRALFSWNESIFSLRRRTRWIALLSVGGFGGFLLSGFDPTIPYHGKLSINLFSICVCCCELPANTLLYLYLRDLSRRLGDRRVTDGLGICVIAVPILSFVAVILLAFGSLEKSELSTVWRFSIMAYGAAALAAGIVGTTAVLRMAWLLSSGAFGGWLNEAHDAAARLPSYLRTSMMKIDRQWPRWCAVLGLLLWLCSVPLCIQNVLYTPIRFAVGGGVPLLNFAGPKVSSVSLVRVAAMRHATDDDQDPELLPISNQLRADALTLLAVWLVTYSIPGLDPSPKLRWMTRYGILAMVGSSLGAVLAVNNLYNMGPSHFTAWAVLTTEAPATFLVYRHLARLAAGLYDSILALRLRRLAWAAAILAIAPLPSFIVSRRLYDWRSSWTAAGLGALYVMLSFAVALVACCAIVALGWRIVLSAVEDDMTQQQLDFSA